MTDIPLKGLDIGTHALGQLRMELAWLNVQRAVLQHFLGVSRTRTAPWSGPEGDVSFLLGEIVDGLAPIAARALPHAQDITVETKQVGLTRILYQMTLQVLKERALVWAGYLAYSTVHPASIRTRTPIAL